MECMNLPVRDWHTGSLHKKILVLPRSGTMWDGHYRLLLSRPLITGDPEDIELRSGEFIPIAFQAWEGSNGETGTRMALSSWYSLVLEETTSTSALLYAGLAAVIVIAGEVVLMRRIRP